jgi:primosomal protein N' (replication factor Y)
MTQLAKVAVAAATYAIDRPYDYAIPTEMSLCVGSRVMVPFGRGNKKSEGVVLALSDCLPRRPVKAVFSALDEQPVLGEREIKLALWMRERYFCTVYEALHTILPAGLWVRHREIYHMVESERAGLGEREQQVCDLLRQAGGSADFDTLRQAVGQTAFSLLKGMAEKGILSVKTESSRAIHDKMVRLVSLAMDAETALDLATAKKKTAPRRYNAVRFLCDYGETSASELCYFTGATAQTIRTMEKAGLVTCREAEEYRVPRCETVPPGVPIVLNEEQQQAFAEILELVQGEKPAVALLHGVTGSGKTQVYIRLAQEVLQSGRTVMILVPEIALTPQIMGKFRAYFGNDVAMLHSALKLSERYDQWKRIRSGEVHIVLGTRSAVFAPLKNIGLIVMDEEQESSYQSENAPGYHARDIAKYLCVQENAVLLLGSATPTVESAYFACTGVYHASCLRRRYNEHALPHVLLADMRQELKCGNTGDISHTLYEELKKNIDAGEQSILFLNRRGNSRMLLCGECGGVPQCPRCSVPLTYHSANHRLMCHYCGYSQKAYDTCPDCGGVMKHIGTGTQKVEAELQALFPNIQILRMDADTVSVANGHEKLLRQFVEQKIPILLGTQMVAKGLDFENVTLVGVLAADLSLYVDSYRAAERTFSLLTQVVGRAGRGEKTGRAVIQTYTPGNDVIEAASAQDYDRFYDAEIRMRKLRRDPPFADQFFLTVTGTEESRVLRACGELCRAVAEAARGKEYEAYRLEVLGPAPAPVVKVNNRYRYRMLLIGRNEKNVRNLIACYLRAFSQKAENRGLNIFADCNLAE